jgi:hypothetical protein
VIPLQTLVELSAPLPCIEPQCDVAVHVVLARTGLETSVISTGATAPPVRSRRRRVSECGVFAGAEASLLESSDGGTMAHWKAIVVPKMRTAFYASQNKELPRAKSTVDT